MGKGSRDAPEETVDKAVVRAADAAGSLIGDETLEAEGRASGRVRQRSTYRMLAQPEARWIVETGGTGQISSVHRTKDQAVTRAKEAAKTQEPRQVLIYRKASCSWRPTER